MNKPVVAIIGRPNVGKSTLFNRLTGNRQAIVEGEPNVTRDRIYGHVEWLDREFIIVDTGGIDIGRDEEIKNKAKRQAEFAMEEADLILFIVDARSGLTALDEEIVGLLRKKEKKVLQVVNKVDTFNNVEEQIWEFYNTGFGEPVPVSAEHGKNTGNLLDEVVNNLQFLPVEEADDEEVLDIAIVGRPNVGKSTFVNYLAGSERVIVSAEPGTTRDAVDTIIEVGENVFRMIDTAGLRRKSRVSEDVEYYSNLRAIRAIERADGVLMMIDASEGVAEQDKKISGYAHDEGKPIVLALNKWDLVDKYEDTMDTYRDEVYYQLKFLQYAPVTFMSALKGERILEVMELLEYVVDQNNLRVKTGMLNEVIQQAVELRQPPSKKGRRLKIFYATQTGVRPPSFVIFVNDPELMHFAYQRYIENSLRETFGFVGTPIRIKLKKRN
ncbi:MAG: ribosome biogenesis GTPase Der [Halanaerobiaceae bacterium]